MFTDGEDNLLRVADPSFVAACQPLNVSRYYNCDIAVANDTEIVNRTWLTCPTYIGKTIECRYTYRANLIQDEIRMGFVCPQAWGSLTTVKGKNCSLVVQVGEKFIARYIVWIRF